MQRYTVPTVEVPEDVLADDGQLTAESPLPPMDAVPEDTVSELDREARLKDAERELELSEGRLPADGYVE
jgi:hypothetical protein